MTGVVTIRIYTRDHDGGRWHVASGDGGCSQSPDDDEGERAETIDTSWPNWKIEDELVSETDELCEECFPFPPEE